MFGKKGNNDRPIIQSSGYNGSEPTRVCPNCGEEKPLSDFGYRNMSDGTIANAIRLKRGDGSCSS